MVMFLFKELWHFTYPFHQKPSICYSAPPHLFFLSLTQNFIYLFLSKAAKYIISDVYVNYLEKTLQKYEYWILHPISKVYLYNSTEMSLRQECFLKASQHLSQSDAQPMIIKWDLHFLGHHALRYYL